MFRIEFINMPFAQLRMPALGVTMLRGALQERFGSDVEVGVRYFNQEFCKYLGYENYEYIVDNLGAANSGFGDWLFRQIAFPDAEDNTESYLKRFFPQQSPQVAKFLEEMQEKREGLNAFMDELVERYSLADADVVGFTSMFSQNCASFAMARKVKEHNSEVVTLIGGANCESPMGEEIARGVEQIDFVFSGPALISGTQFVDALMKKDTESLHKIDGVFSRRNVTLFGGLAKGAKIGAELPLDEPVPLDYDDFLDTIEANFPREQVDPILLFETSRGCWWGERAHCTFCGLNGVTMAYRAMQPELAVNLIHDLFRYADRCSQFHSVDNILPVNYFTEVLPKIEAPDHVTLFYEIKANLKKEEVEALSRARIKIVQPGIEALNSGTLKLMKKGATSFVNLALLENCSIYDVYPAWNLLVGFPGEKDDVYKKYIDDIPRLVHLPPPSGVYPVRFDRFSPYFTLAEDYGLKLEPYDFYKMIYPFSDESLANMAYYFMDRNYRANYFTDMVKWLVKMRSAVVTWGELWNGEGKEDHQPPRLHFIEDGTRVLDSRFGREATYDVGPVGKRILQELKKPRTIAALDRLLGEEIPGFAAKRELARLNLRKLLFEDDGKYVSLVFDKPPKPMSHFLSAAAA